MVTIFKAGVDVKKQIGGCFMPTGPLKWLAVPTLNIYLSSCEGPVFSVGNRWVP